MLSQHSTKQYECACHFEVGLYINFTSFLLFIHFRLSDNYFKTELKANFARVILRIAHIIYCQKKDNNYKGFKRLFTLKKVTLYF